MGGKFAASTAVVNPKHSKPAASPPILRAETKTIINHPSTSLKTIINHPSTSLKTIINDPNFFHHVKKTINTIIIFKLLLPSQRLPVASEDPKTAYQRSPRNRKKPWYFVGDKDMHLVPWLGWMVK
jgi:hypothetical protein